MKPNDIIDRAVSEIRGETISSEQLEGVGERVRSRLVSARGKVLAHPGASATIEDCAGFQALIPAYRSSSLSASRKMLLEDHLAGCVDCRQALSHGNAPAGARGRLKPAPTTWRVAWAIAAIVIIAIGISQIGFVRDLIRPVEVYAMANTIDGNLYSVSGQDIKPVTAGQRIERDHAVRTGVKSGAVLQLADGSRIEMAERSELALTRARDGVRIELQRGNIIVTAAKQRNGHLYVGTPDSTISVVGTVFAVSAGAKGSRVSVIEGEVHVEYAEMTKAIHPGEQISTSLSVATVPISEDIRWSRELDKHLNSLKASVALSATLTGTLGNAGLRTTSDLVPLLPAGTVVFASMPNTGKSTADSFTLLRERIAENTMLNDWLRRYSDRGESALDKMAATVAGVADFLGPEIVIGIGSSTVLLADVLHRDQLVTALGGESVALSRDVSVRVTPQFLVMTNDPASLQQTGFSSSSLYQRVAQAYREGVGWLLAADLEQINPTIGPAGDDIELGLTSARQLVVEQKTGPGGAAYQATLGFKGQRTGLSSWLGAPSNMGALEFVSPTAYSVAGVITKNASNILDDILVLFQHNSLHTLQALNDYQEKNHIDLRHDVAEQLGNEFLFALDGALLPSPSWKVIIEVNDAARLQNALQSSVNEINRQAAEQQKPGITLHTETSGGLTFYSMSSPEFPSELHYTFWAGYLIIAPNRGVLTQALNYRNTANSLARSREFRSQLPADGRDDLSGIVYFNLKAVTDSMPAGTAPNITLPLPSLICLYGQNDAIVMTSKGVLGTNIASADILSSMTSAIHHDVRSPR